MGGPRYDVALFDRSVSEYSGEFGETIAQKPLPVAEAERANVCVSDDSFLLE